MFFKPLAYPSTLDRRSLMQSVVLRGGALEPDPCSPARKAQAKADTYSAVAFPAHGCRGSFSLRRGLDSIQSCFKLSITFCSTLSGRLPNKKGDPLWVALVWLCF